MIKFIKNCINAKTISKFFVKSFKNTLQQAIFGSKIRTFGRKNYQNHLDNLGYGENIPLVFGTMPVTGVLLWQSEVVEHLQTNSYFIKLQS